MTSIGCVTGDREVVVPLLVRNRDGADRQVDALLDTGLSGYVALPARVIELLELQRLGREQVTLASGKTHLVGKYEATIGFGGSVHSVEVVEAGEPLVGMGLLWGFDLRIQCMDGGQVVLERLS
ncbi:hypothetical protein [Salinibacter ruber]|uniref:hypothetical protein n=1 Tax=Salinibacter ruber TaxID=146919 RepID=UPI0021689440|nr:hypothetical protein [Salinibacter ruber]MCS4185171.1 clan AA aspartic protease [Salinibacter ruber]